MKSLRLNCKTLIFALIAALVSMGGQCTLQTGSPDGEGEQIIGTEGEGEEQPTGREGEGEAEGEGGGEPVPTEGEAETEVIPAEGEGEREGEGEGVGLYPLSDPDNTGNWVLKEDLSDEFEGTSLDTNKWFKDGTNGVFKYSWPGRAPSQFAPENIRVEDGKLKLQTKWDPNYDFVDGLDNDCGCPYGDPPLTTAAVISNNTLTYGYLEIMCKAADSSITSSFWATSNVGELDIFEFVGDSKTSNVDNRFPFCVHDWTQGGDSWCDRVTLDWRVADDLHVYGCEWDANGLKFYADGELVHEVSKSTIGNLWQLDEPMFIWFDSEAFAWEGLPTQSELPVDYEIAYIRVWQKE